MLPDHHINRSITSFGRQPQAGLAINIYSNTRLILIFVLISGLQLILLLVTTFMASSVIVVDDSPLAIARLLQPIMNRLGYGGTILGGREIADAFKKEDTEVLKH